MPLNPCTRLRAGHHGDPTGIDAQTVTIKAEATGITVTATTAGRTPVTQLQRRPHLCRQRLAIGTGLQHPDGVFERADGSLADDSHQLVAQAGAVGWRIGDRADVNLDLILIAGLMVETFDALIEQLEALAARPLDLQTGLRPDTNAIHALGGDSQRAAATAFSRHHGSRQ